MSCLDRRHCNDYKNQDNKAFFCEEGVCVGDKVEEGEPCWSSGNNAVRDCVHNRYRKKEAQGKGNFKKTMWNGDINWYNIPGVDKCNNDRECISSDQFCDTTKSECVIRNYKDEPCPKGMDGLLGPCSSGSVCYDGTCVQACNENFPCGKKRDCVMIKDSKFGYCASSAFPVWAVILICVTLTALIIFAVLFALKMYRRRNRKSAQNAISPPVSPYYNQTQYSDANAPSTDYKSGY